MTITVLKPGLLSTFQDLGRFGYQHLGVPACGAMDGNALRLANLLAGNDPGCAALEITLVGPRLRFEQPACFAIAGADLGATLNGEPAALHRPLVARAGDELAWTARVRGARCYLAVHGGFALDTVMGSDSTYLRSGFGGLQGRALAKGDHITLRRPLRGQSLQDLVDMLWQQRIYLPAGLSARPDAAVRIMPGAQWNDFSAASRQALVEAIWRIGAQSDRMGYRLEGPPLALSSPRQLLSEAIAFGAIQVPAGGAPIVLMADRQTTGGYPKIAQVATVDLPVLAQKAPGDAVSFELIDLGRAQRLDALREQSFVRLHESLAWLRERLRAYREEPT